MSKVKGSGMIILKKILEKHHINIERQLFPKLTPDGKNAFTGKVAISWIEIPVEAQGSPIYETACMLYPGNPNQALQRLGEITAQEAPWFYKIFFRVPTKEFLFERLDKLWKAFYDTGTMSYSDLNEHGVTFVMTDYPQFPEYMRQYMCGWFKGFMHLLNVRATSVTLNDKDKNNWKWIIKW